MWIIYFCCYISSIGTLGEQVNISGTLLIKQDSVVAYLYPVGYLKWKIDAIEDHHEELDRRHYQKTGLYLLSNEYGKSVLRIGDDRIIHYIMINEISYYETIEYKKTHIYYEEVE